MNRLETRDRVLNHTVAGYIYIFCISVFFLWKKLCNLFYFMDVLLFLKIHWQRGQCWPCQDLLSGQVRPNPFCCLCECTYWHFSCMNVSQSLMMWSVALIFCNVDPCRPVMVVITLETGDSTLPSFLATLVAVYIARRVLQGWQTFWV